jgi:predicted  nucleic acid-binding Zn-ribbon protein
LESKEKQVLKLETELEEVKDRLNEAKRKGAHLLIDECSNKNWKLQEKIAEVFEEMVEVEREILEVRERFPLGEEVS